MTLRDAQRFFRWYSVGYFACGLYEVLSPTRGLDNYSILAKTFAEYHVRRWILCSILPSALCSMHPGTLNCKLPSELDCMPSNRIRLHSACTLNSMVTAAVDASYTWLHPSGPRPLKKQANSRHSRTAQRIHNLRVRPFRAQQVDYLTSNKCLNQTTINGIDMVWWIVIPGKDSINYTIHPCQLHQLRSD